MPKVLKIAAGKKRKHLEKSNDTENSILPWHY